MNPLPEPRHSRPAVNISRTGCGRPAQLARPSRSGWIELRLHYICASDARLFVPSQCDVTCNGVPPGATTEAPVSGQGRVTQLLHSYARARRSRAAPRMRRELWAAPAISFCWFASGAGRARWSASPTANRKTDWHSPPCSRSLWDLGWGVGALCPLAGGSRAARRRRRFRFYLIDGGAGRGV